jgi:hypothetical protein
MATARSNAESLPIKKRPSGRFFVFRQSPNPGIVSGPQTRPIHFLAQFNQLGQAVDLHFFKDVGTVLFGGIGQHLQMRGNAFVGVALQHQAKHIAFTGTQGRVPAAHFIVLDELSPVIHIEL